MKGGIIDWPYMETVFEVWEGITKNVDRDPTENELRKMGAELRAMGFSKHRRGPKRLLEFFQNRQRYSPDVDEIAIERAVSFDENVYEWLTDREHIALVEALVAMHDPFSRLDSEPTTGDRWHESGAIHGAVSKRRRAFEALPEARRRYLQYAVARGKRAQAVAA